MKGLYYIVSHPTHWGGDTSFKRYIPKSHWNEYWRGRCFLYQDKMSVWGRGHVYPRSIVSLTTQLSVLVYYKVDLITISLKI